MVREVRRVRIERDDLIAYNEEQITCTILQRRRHMNAVYNLTFPPNHVRNDWFCSRENTILSVFKKYDLPTDDTDVRSDWTIRRVAFEYLKIYFFFFSPSHFPAFSKQCPFVRVKAYVYI